MTVFEEMVKYHAACIQELPPSDQRAKFQLQEDKLLTPAWTNLIDVVLQGIPLDQAATTGTTGGSNSNTTSMAVAANAAVVDITGAFPTTTMNAGSSKTATSNTGPDISNFSLSNASQLNPPLDGRQTKFVIESLLHMTKNPNSKSYQYLLNSRKEKVIKICEKVITSFLPILGLPGLGEETNRLVLLSMELLARFDTAALEKIMLASCTAASALRNQPETNHAATTNMSPHNISLNRSHILCVTLSMEAVHAVLKRLHPSQAPPPWKTRLSFAKTAAELVQHSASPFAYSSSTGGGADHGGIQQQDEFVLKVACVTLIGTLMQCSKLFVDADLPTAAQFVPVLIHQIKHTDSRKVFIEAAWALSKLTCGNRFACEHMSTSFLLEALQSCAEQQKPAIRPFTVLIRRIAGLAGIAELLERFLQMIEQKRLQQTGDPAGASQNINNAAAAPGSSALYRELVMHLCWVISEDTEDEELSAVKGANDEPTLRRLLQALASVIQEHTNPARFSEMVVEAGVKAIARLGELRMEPRILQFLRDGLNTNSANIRTATLEALCNLLLKQHHLLFVRQAPHAAGDATAALEDILALVNSNLDDNTRATSKDELGYSLRLRIILAPLRVRMDSIRTNTSFDEQQSRYYREAFRRATDAILLMSTTGSNGGPQCAHHLRSSTSSNRNSGTTSTSQPQKTYSSDVNIEDAALLQQLLSFGSDPSASSPNVATLFKDRFPVLCVCFGELLNDEMFPKEDVPQDAFDRLCLVFCRCLQQCLPPSAFSGAMNANNQNSFLDPMQMNSDLDQFHLRKSVSSVSSSTYEHMIQQNTAVALQPYCVTAIEILAQALQLCSPKFPVAEVAMPIFVETLRHIRIDKHEFISQVCGAFNSLIANSRKTNLHRLSSISTAGSSSDDLTNVLQQNNVSQAASIEKRLQELGLDRILQDWIKCYPENRNLQREAFLTLGLTMQSAKPILQLMQSQSFAFHTIVGAVIALTDLVRLGYAYPEDEASLALTLIQVSMQTFSNSRSKEDGTLEAQAEVCVGLLASRTQRQNFSFPKDSPHYVDPKASATSSLSSTTMTSNNSSNSNPQSAFSYSQGPNSAPTSPHQHGFGAPQISISSPTGGFNTNPMYGGDQPQLSPFNKPMTSAGSFFGAGIPNPASGGQQHSPHFQPTSMTSATFSPTAAPQPGSSPFFGASSGGMPFGSPTGGPPLPQMGTATLFSLS